MPIIDDIGALPNGKTAKLAREDVLGYLRMHYVLNRNEQIRREIHASRGEMYRDAGDGQLITDIDAIFDDQKVKNLRKRFVEIARYNNISKRLIHEISTVYARPAKRSVQGAFNDSQYQALLRMTRHDQMMRRCNRLTNLHRQTLLGFRVRRQDRRPVTSVVSPDRFFAVSHPLDPTHLIAVIIDLETSLFAPSDSDPAFMVWTDTEYFALTSAGTIVQDSWVEHGLGLMPWLLVSVEPPVDSLLDSTQGADIPAGHRACWFQQVLLLKESTSLSNQVIFSGDMASTPTGQTMDTGSDGIVGEDVQINQVDRGVDLGQFRTNIDHILDTLAANWGLPPSVLRHEGATSGYEMELRRIGIRERRREQEPVFRDVERAFAEIQSVVLQKEAPELSFLTAGWGINFGETQTPQDPTERMNLFEKERQLGLSNTLEMIMERDPDLTPQQALAELKRNIMVETLRIREMQEQQQMNAGPSAEQGDATPEENGDEGQNEA